MDKNKKKFIPICFVKELTKFQNAKASEYFKINTKNEKIIKKELLTNLNAKDIYTILKNFDLSIKTCSEVEYSKHILEFLSASKLIRISKNCDLYLVQVKRLILGIFNYNFNFKIIRFYSYSHVNNCYFFIFRIFSDKNDKFKYCQGGLVLPTNEKKIFIYMKRSKQFSFNNHREFFEMFVNNLVLILDVMGQFITKEDFDRLSTVESLETDAELEVKKNENKFYQNINDDESSSEDDQDEPEFKDAYSEKILDWDNLDLEEIQRESESKLKKMKNSKFIVNELDEDYLRARKINENGLKNLDPQYYNIYNQLKSELCPELDIKYKSTENKLDNEFIRYIVGWKGDYVNIKKTLIELFNWREDYKPHMIKYEEFLGYKFNPKELMHVPCQDIYGRPCILIKAKHLIPKNVSIEIFVRYLIFNMEHAISLMPDNIDKIVVILDIKDAGLENLSMNHINQIKELTSKYYVERLSNIIIINKGFFFGVLWSVVSKFLDDRVTKKLIIIQNSKIEWFKKIMGDSYDKIYS